MASKTSGLLWIGAFGLILFLFWLTGPKTSKTRRDFPSLGVWAAKLAGWIGLALLVLWATYLFEIRPLTPGGLPIPAASHWEGLFYQGSNVTVGQTTFLAGWLISGGHWLYFPLALLVKTPLPMWAGLLLAMAWSLRRKAGQRWSIIPLTVVPLTYLLAAILIALNIGHRHILPVLPFAFVFVAQLAGEQITRQATPRWMWAILGLLAIWYVLGTLAVFPHYLTYFNELAGGPDGGYRYLADSSVDWGQGIKALRHYLDEQDIETVRLAAFSSLDPALYGLDFEPIPPTTGAPITLTAQFNPQPGWYAISATPLQGIWVLDPDTYDWFRHRQPVAQVGHVLFVYNVTPDDPPPSWVAQCAAPSPPLDAGQIAAGFGRSDLRLAAFDCEQSWLYPSGGTGWTVLPGDSIVDDWMSERLDGLFVSFHQGEFWSRPALTIYEQQETPTGAIPPQVAVRVAPSDWPVDKTVAEGTEAKAPLDTGGPLTFLGYQAQTQSNGIELHTYWRVDEIPTRQLSLMAHLLTADGATVAVGDGLGVSIQVWRPGDVIVQRHHLAVPQENTPAPYWLQVGAYWLDTMERWPIVIDGQTVGDRFLLTEFSMSR